MKTSNYKHKFFANGVIYKTLIKHLNFSMITIIFKDSDANTIVISLDFTIKCLSNVIDKNI